MNKKISGFFIIFILVLVAILSIQTVFAVSARSLAKKRIPDCSSRWEKLFIGTFESPADKLNGIPSVKNIKPKDIVNLKQLVENGCDMKIHLKPIGGSIGVESTIAICDAITIWPNTGNEAVRCKINVPTEDKASGLEWGNQFLYDNIGFRVNDDIVEMLAFRHSLVENPNDDGGWLKFSQHSSPLYYMADSTEWEITVWLRQ